MDPVEWMFQVWKWNAIRNFYVIVDNAEKQADAENEIDNLFAGLPPGFSVSETDKKTAFNRLCQFFDNQGPWRSSTTYIRRFMYPIDEEGMKALDWLAARYDSAECMLDKGSYFGHDYWDLYRCPVMLLTEDDIQTIYESTEGDGGDPGTMPCAGGSLLNAWNFFQEKV